MLEITTNSTYHGVSVGQLVSAELSTRAGVRKTKENELLNQADIISKCLEDLKVYTQHLGNKLYEKVFCESDKKMIESLRVLLDLEGLCMKIKTSGAAHVASIQSKQFIEKSRSIVQNIEDISDQEIRLQYRDFLRIIENQIDEIEKDKLDLYLNIETIIHILCSAATTMSVESVVESQ